MIVGDPSPIDDIAGPDDDPARVIVGPALSDVDIYRRRRSQDRQQDQKNDRQSEIHVEGFAADRVRRRLSRKRVGAINLG